MSCVNIVHLILIRKWVCAIETQQGSSGLFADFYRGKYRIADDPDRKMTDEDREEELERLGNLYASDFEKMVRFRAHFFCLQPSA